MDNNNIEILNVDILSYVVINKYDIFNCIIFFLG